MTKLIEQSKARAFFLSETEAEFSVDFSVDKCLSLRYSYLLSSYTQNHPYGDSTCEETFTEVIEDSRVFELDGVEVSLSELETLFGSEWVSKTIEQMENE